MLRRGTDVNLMRRTVWHIFFQLEMAYIMMSLLFIYTVFEN